MQLTRKIPGHFRTNETGGAWLADVVLDLSAFPAGTLPVTFAADVLVGGSSDQGDFYVSTGDAPRSTGDHLCADLSVNGPFVGRVTVPNLNGVVRSSSPVVLHLACATNNANYVEIQNVVVTVGTP